ncbi:MAG: DUF924 family protein [Desulfopila sp.]
MEFDTVLHFWFEEITPAQWFNKDEQFDRQIVRRFGDMHAQAARCVRQGDKGSRSRGQGVKSAFAF